MRYLILTCFVLVLISCHTKVEKTSIRFFSLKHFFEQESTRLAKTKQYIDKSVSYNGSIERKKVLIKDWKNELNTFAESDINKSAWRDSYQVVKDSNYINYYALDSTLRTRNIMIRKDMLGKLIRLDIINKTNNLLYQSLEHLTYIPDSIYAIDKKQHVILIGDNHYFISGRFNQGGKL